MRIFNYKVFTYVPDCENQLNETTKGQVIIKSDDDSEDEIKEKIINSLFSGDKNCTVTELKLVPEL